MKKILKKKFFFKKSSTLGRSSENLKQFGEEISFQLQIYLEIWSDGEGEGEGEGEEEEEEEEEGEDYSMLGVV